MAPSSIDNNDTHKISAVLRSLRLSGLPLFFFQIKACKKSAVSCGQKSRRANPIIRFQKRKNRNRIFSSPSGIYQKGRSLWARYKNTAEEPSSKNRSECHRSIQVSGHSWVSKWPVCVYIGYTVCPFFSFISGCPAFPPPLRRRDGSARPCVKHDCLCMCTTQIAGREGCLLIPLSHIRWDESVRTPKEISKRPISYLRLHCIISVAQNLILIS